MSCQLVYDLEGCSSCIPHIYFSPAPLRGHPVIISFIFGVILRALIAHASVDGSGNGGLSGKIAKGLNLCETQLSAEDHSFLEE